MARAMDRFYRPLEQAAPWLLDLPPLLAAALGAIALVLLGGLLRRLLPRLAGVLAFSGNAVLIGVFMLAALRFVQLEPAFDRLAPSLAMPVQTVAGGETRVPLSGDGHYWIEAQVNGREQRFMVDTGATLTALSAEAAERAGLEPDPLRLPVVVRTANGPVDAQMVRLDDLRFGSIVARDLDAVVTPAMGGLNVLGMNFLSRLKGWRVEDGVLVLTPRAAAPAPAPEGG